MNHFSLAQCDERWVQVARAHGEGGLFRRFVDTGQERRKSMLGDIQPLPLIIYYSVKVPRYAAILSQSFHGTSPLFLRFATKLLLNTMSLLAGVSDRNVSGLQRYSLHVTHNEKAADPRSSRRTGPFTAENVKKNSTHYPSNCMASTQLLRP